MKISAMTSILSEVGVGCCFNINDADKSDWEDKLFFNNGEENGVDAAFTVLLVMPNKGSEPTCSLLIVLETFGGRGGVWTGWR